MDRPWHATRYRANLIDMHIPDWDGAFLADFDPVDYVDRLVEARVEVAYLYATSCLGICYWPTQSGHQHASLHGRDILGERITECRRRGIDVVVYCNWWSKWAYDEHPDWRVVDPRGRHTADYLWTPGRYGVCCFNSPHADLVVAQVEELCTGYDFDGLWVDMIFWPYTVCHCDHCRQRYRREAGADLPTTVDWDDPAWVAFQRRREAWMTEVVARVTETARRCKPGVSVGHQCSPWAVGWASGVTSAFFEHSDYVAGDFYAGAAEQSLVCKLLTRLGEQPRFEFMTSRTPDLTDHTTMKSPALLAMQTWSTLAHNGRTLFIDAVDPRGTLNPAVYERLGELFGAIEPLQACLTPDAKPLADIGIYFNFESLIDPADNGLPLAEVDAARPMPVIASLMNLARTLLDGHVAHAVLTPKDLDALDDFAVLVLPELFMVSEAEAEALRDYVARGGRLYATGTTSLRTMDGQRRDDFLLADVFGVSWQGCTDESVTYLAPTAGHEDLLSPCTAAHPLLIAGPQTRVAAADAARVLATVTLPYTDPDDATRFSSAISNPPGIATDLPALVLHDYGAGRTLYAAGPLDRMSHDTHRVVFRRLLAQLTTAPLVRTDLPAAAEVLVHDQERQDRLLICVVNFQADLPPIPVRDARLEIRLDGRVPTRLQRLPEGQAVDFTVRNGYAAFTVDRLDEILMLGLEYRS